MRSWPKRITDPRLVSLDRLRRKRRWSVEKLSEKLALNQRTLRYWFASDRVPPKRWAQIDSLVGGRISPDRWTVGWCDGPEKIGTAEAQRRKVGFAAVWLSTSIGGVTLSLAVDPVNPVAQVVRWEADAAVRSVRFFFDGDRFLYMAFRHQAVVLKTEFEGCVDATGLEFCREFLALQVSPLARGEGRWHKTIRKAHHTNFHV